MKFIEVTTKKMEESPNEEEKAPLREELDESGKSWQDITKQSDVRQKAIDKLMKPAKKYSEKEKTFVAILKDLEKRVKEINMIPEKQQTAQDALKEIKVRC